MFLKLAYFYARAAQCSYDVRVAYTHKVNAIFRRMSALYRIVFLILAYRAHASE